MERRVRLQKFIAEAGICSRRKAEQLILEGKVRVNGEIVRVLGVKVNPEKDIVEVEGQVVKPKKKRYVALHKPKGYICTRSDEKGRKCVFDLLPPEWSNLYPVGRLDRGSEGLLFLTNDGEFAFRLTHPRFSVPKVYYVEVRGPFSPLLVEQMLKGVEDRGELLKAEKVKVLSSSSRRATLEITLTEGKNREIRRMMSTLGLRVERLVRTQIGPIRLGELPPGKWRVLTQAEVDALWKVVQGGANRANTGRPD